MRKVIKLMVSLDFLNTLTQIMYLYPKFRDMPPLNAYISLYMYRFHGYEL